MSPPPRFAGVAALVDDLMFTSRIREAARAGGLEVRAVRRAADLVEACRQGAAAAVVDLDSPRLSSLEAVRALRAEPALASLPVIGFFSHVDAEKGRAGREAGCTEVLPRSAFVVRLPELLAEAARRPAPPLE